VRTARTAESLQNTAGTSSTGRTIPKPRRRASVAPWHGPQEGGLARRSTTRSRQRSTTRRGRRRRTTASPSTAVGRPSHGDSQEGVLQEARRARARTRARSLQGQEQGHGQGHYKGTGGQHEGSGQVSTGGQHEGSGQGRPRAYQEPKDNGIH
jgi:hypothetical protein